MSVYTQRSFFRPYLIVHALHLFSELFYRSGRVLIYLVSPEDTTEIGEARQRHSCKYNGNDIFGVIKALLWIVISISIVLLLGQLG